MPRTSPGTYEAISLIGAICGKDAEAAALVADMQASFQAIADKAEDTGKTVYFEVSPWNGACGPRARIPLWMSWPPCAA